MYRAAARTRAGRAEAAVLFDRNPPIQRDAFQSLDDPPCGAVASPSPVAAELNHPHMGPAICGIEEAPATPGPGVRALVLGDVEGQTLAERLDASVSASRRGLAATEALSIARQIADGLDAAHGNGVVRRDLKPANIKIRPMASSRSSRGAAATRRPRSTRSAALHRVAAPCQPSDATRTARTLVPHPGSCTRHTCGWSTTSACSLGIGRTSSRLRRRRCAASSWNARAAIARQSAAAEASAFPSRKRRRLPPSRRRIWSRSMPLCPRWRPSIRARRRSSSRNASAASPSEDDRRRRRSCRRRRSSAKADRQTLALSRDDDGGGPVTPERARQITISCSRPSKGAAPNAPDSSTRPVPATRRCAANWTRCWPRNLTRANSWRGADHGRRGDAAR